MEASLIKDLWRINCESHGAGHRSLPHIHISTKLAFLRRGRIRVRFEGGRTFLLVAPGLLLVPPLLWHEFLADQPSQMIAFKFLMAPHYWASVGTQPYRSSLDRKFADWAGRFVREECLAGQEARVLTAKCLIEAARHNQLVSITHSGEERFHYQLLQILERVMKDSHAHWSVESMAREFHLSVRHFTRRFRSIVDQTPREYLFKIKMRAAAAELVQKPHQPIRIIGEKAGYATIHAFTRAFTQTFRTSPGSYRRLFSDAPNRARLS
jgi:AraC-like DNA-binding protein